MATLTGVSISSSYTSLLKLDGNTDSTAAGNGSNAIQVKTGDNEATPLFLNTDRLGIGGQPSSLLSIKGQDPTFTIESNRDNVSSSEILGQIDFRTNEDSFSGEPATSARIKVVENEFAATTMSFHTSTNPDDSLNTAMVIDKDGKIGLNEDSPDKELHLKGSEPTFRIEQTADANKYFDAQVGSGGGVSKLKFSSETNSNTLVVANNARVGINNGAPTETLDVTGNAKISGNVGIGGDASNQLDVFSAGDAVIGAKSTTNSSGNDAIFLANVAGSSAGDPMMRFNIDGVGAWSIGVDNDDSDKFKISGLSSVLGTNDRFIIDTSGLVGIGTEVPGDYDAGADNLVVYDSVNAGITIAGSTSGQSNIHFGDGTGVSSYRGVIQYRHSSDEMRFWSNGSHKLSLNSSGDLDFNGNYVVDEQGRQNHVANTMSSPYYYFPSSSSYITAGTGNADLVVAEKASWVVCGAFGSTNNNTRFLRSTDGINLEIQSNTTLNVEIYHSSTTAVRNITNVIDNDMSIHCFAITYNEDNDKKIKVYKDGVLQTGGTDTAGAGDLSSASGDEFLIGNTHAKSAGFIGSLYDVKVFNTALNATEVKELYSGMSVPFKYKGANQTNILTGVHDDFDTDVANQSAFNSNYTQLQATGFVGSGGAISVSSNVMAMTGIVSGHGINGLGLLTKGKKYRMTFNVTAITGNWYLDFLNQSESAFSGTGLKTVEWTAGGSDLNIYSGGSGGALTIDASSTVVELIPIGAVAEYDGSGIASDEWFDKSGNDLHGTVSGASVENAPSGDDGLIYEEGTFTVTTNSDGTGALSSQLGEYTRIGNAVHFRIVIDVSTNFASNSIGGLPYTCNQSASPSSLIGGIVALTSANNDEPIMATVSAGGTTVSFFSSTDASDTHLPNTTNDVYRLTGTYFT